jgi:hypothetical protein
LSAVSSEPVRLLTKLTAFFEPSFHRPHQENASKHKITISVPIQSKPNRVWSKTEHTLFDHLVGAAEDRKA